MIQVVDVQLPTTDGRELNLSRYTQPEAEHRMLLEQLRLALPRLQFDHCLKASSIAFARASIERCA